MPAMVAYRFPRPLAAAQHRPLPLPTAGCSAVTPPSSTLTYSGAPMHPTPPSTGYERLLLPSAVAYRRRPPPAAAPHRPPPRIRAGFQGPPPHSTPRPRPLTTSHHRQPPLIKTPAMKTAPVIALLEDTKKKFLTVREAIEHVAAETNRSVARYGFPTTAPSAAPIGPTGKGG